MGKRSRRRDRAIIRRPPADVGRFELRLLPRFAAWRKANDLPDDYQMSREEWDELVAATVMEVYGDWTATARRVVAKMERRLELPALGPSRLPREAA